MDLKQLLNDCLIVLLIGPKRILQRLQNAVKSVTQRALVANPNWEQPRLAMLRLRRTASDLHLITHHLALNGCLRKNRNNSFRRPDVALNFVGPFDADLHVAVDKHFVAGIAQAPLQ